MWDEHHTPNNTVRLDEATVVEQDVLNIIQKIMEYDPNLKVQYLERAASLGDAPWRVIERCRDGEWRVIFYAWAMDERVIERLRAADCFAVDVLSGVENNNCSLRQQEGRRFQEKMEEAKDLVEHIIRSPKGRYTFRNSDGDLVTVDDDPKPSWKVEG